MTTSSTAPADWVHLVEACGGGFFHSQPALTVSFPPGDPMFVTARRPDGTLGVALGVQRRCKLRGLHVYCATPPAVTRDAPSASAVLTELVRHLRDSGAVELTMDSFGGDGEGSNDLGGTPLRRRREYRVGLKGDGELLASLGTTHRRHVRRGIREGWRLDALEGAEALQALHQVQDTAAQRGASEAEKRFRPAVLRAEAVSALTTVREPVGLCLYAGSTGAELLSAALIGWANGHAFYLIGGSTPEGYERYSATWLHWAIMSELQEAGFLTYNLGGTPAEASSEGHEQHGLHRFKARFNGLEVICRGSHWQWSPGHERLHRVVDAGRRAFAKLHRAR